jgi:hypothetical protein
VAAGTTGDTLVVRLGGTNFAVSPGSVTQPTTGTAQMTFTVTRVGDTSRAVQVQYRTVDGTARAGVHYQAAAGTLTFPAGVTTRQVSVTILADTVFGGDLNFTLALSGAVYPVAFGVAASVTAGDRPSAVAAGDLDRDGRVDLVAVDANTNTVVALRNTTPTTGAAAAQFTALPAAGVGAGARAVAVADLNLDGFPDVVTVNEAAGTVTVLRTVPTAGGGFTLAAGQSFPAGSGPVAIAVADLDLDGKPDLVVANPAAGTVTILVNTTLPGAGSFGFFTAPPRAVGLNPTAVAVGDVNADGKPDIAVAGSGRAAVLLTGGGGVTAVATDGGAAGVALADVTGDGRADRVVSDAASNTVSVFPSITGGAVTAVFAPRVTFATGAGPAAVAAADVNGDGRPDLLVSETGADVTAVLLNATTDPVVPVFAPGADAAPGSSAAAVVADFNRDGLPDVAAADRFGGAVTVRPQVPPAGTGTPSFAPNAQVYSTADRDRPYSVAVGDLNGDGKADVVTADFEDDTLTVRLNATPTGIPAVLLGDPISVPTAGGPVKAVLADMNEDGRLDVVVGNSKSNSVSVYLNRTGPGSTSRNIAPPPGIAARGWV